MIKSLSILNVYVSECWKRVYLSLATKGTFHFENEYFLWRCASMASPHWLTLRGPLLCNTANCYLFAPEPHNGFQYCLKKSYKYFTDLQVYKRKHFSATHFSIFLGASPGSYSQSIVIFVLLWIPPLDSS